MPQSKKRKKKVHPKKSVQSYIYLSQDYVAEFERVAYRIMTMANIDVADYKALTKRTRHTIMSVKWTPYRVYAEKGAKVPKVYLTFFNNMMRMYEKNTFYGDPKYQVSFLDYVTFGLPFLFALRNDQLAEDVSDPKQLEILDRLNAAATNHMDDFENDHYRVHTNFVMKVLSMYCSLPIYRYYKSDANVVTEYDKGRMQNRIEVSSVQPELKYFKKGTEKHKGYRLWGYDILSKTHNPNPGEMFVPLVMLKECFETGMKKLKEMEDRQNIPVYIQSHAIHRLRERLDCMDNYFLNIILTATFMAPHTVNGVNGQRLLKVFDRTGLLMGYFPFVIQDNAVLILSFLPLSSPITPEGYKLYKALGIEINDSKYIGLDKLSFYLKTDFDKVPQLKDALQQASMWHLTEVEASDTVEKTEDRLLERFFEQRQRYM